jgi:HK97 gp10 family phage protein
MARQSVSAVLKNGKAQRCIAQLNSLQNVGHVAALPLAQLTAKYAREYAHVITGYMRDHTVAKKTGDGKAEVQSNSKQAVFEEFGTRFHEPHPFIRPAIADVAIHGPAMSAQEVNKEIRKRVQSA